MATVEAGFELGMIDLDARCAAGGDAVRRGDLAAWDAAFVESVDFPHLRFIRWLNKHWEDLCKFGEVNPSRTFKSVPPSPRDLHLAAVRNFRKQYPDCTLDIRDLTGIFVAFRDVSRRRVFPLKPMDVLLKFVAARHGISDAKLRHYLANTGKTAERPKRPRGKSARASDEP